jgi:hypothetical protein
MTSPAFSKPSVIFSPCAAPMSSALSHSFFTASNTRPSRSPSPGRRNGGASDEREAVTGVTVVKGMRE